MPAIHATAAVEPGARIAKGATIGPFCTVGANVEIAEGVELVSHVAVLGHTSIGARTRIFPGAVIGGPPQSVRYAGEPTRLVVGTDNVVREHVTMNTGTVDGGGITVVGDRNFIMTGSHVGHDCRIGSNIVMANVSLLGGHVEIGDYAVLGGHCAVHQFVRVGRFAMVSGMTGAGDDVIPFGNVYPYGSSRGSLGGLNLVGMKRRGFTREQIHTVRTAYRLLFAEEGSLEERTEDVSNLYRDSEPVMEIVEFIRGAKRRKICLPYVGHAPPD